MKDREAACKNTQMQACTFRVVACTEWYEALLCNEMNIFDAIVGTSASFQATVRDEGHMARSKHSAGRTPSSWKRQGKVTRSDNRWEGEASQRTGMQRVLTLVERQRSDGAMSPRQQQRLQRLLRAVQVEPLALAAMWVDGSVGGH